jgi:putative acetyltransferase
LSLIIRKEKNSDIDNITDITIAAFKDHPLGNNTEQFIIRELRAAGALTISLIAEIDGKLIGHIAFSPVKVSDGSNNWYGLGPVSVLPEYQKQGIGKALIDEGLSMLKEIGGKGCVLVGEPDYYNRFGFKTLPDLNYEGVPQEFVLALPFEEKSSPTGNVEFHKSFQATE